MSDDVEAVAKVLEPFFLFEGDRTEEAVAAIECLRSRGWRHVPEGWTVVLIDDFKKLALLHCLKHCPSEWKGDKQPHGAECKKYRAMLSAVEKEK